ncbi:MAG: hypothetical protein K1X33_09380 [Methanobacteriaceae archaeon]|nr:hypothetical protein [Methanobacteriaceae archaeon]
MSKTGKIVLFPLNILWQLFLLSYFLFMGFQLKEIFHLFAPNLNPFLLINAHLIILFQADLVVRLIFLKAPQLDIKPYFVLPIKKRTLSWLFFLKSFFNIFNLFWVLTIVPFLITSLNDYPLKNSFLYLFAILIFVFINNLLYLIIKMSSDFKNSYIFIVLIFTILAISVFYRSELKLASYSFTFFNKFLTQGAPYLVLLLVAISVSLFFLTFKLIRKSIYNLHASEPLSGWWNTDIIFNGKKITNEVLSYMVLEFKLLIRNKRTRANLLISFYITALGFLSLFKTEQPKEIFILFFTLIVSNVIAITHGQFLISWESGYFDFLMVRPIQLKNYIKAKYYLFITFSLFLSVFILTPLFIYEKYDLLLLISAVIFNAGLTNFIIIIFSVFNSKKMDLSRGAVGNYQGTQSHHYISIAIMIFLPVLFFILLPNRIHLEILLSTLGLIFIIFHEKWILLTCNLLLRRKYINIENFK